MITYTGITGTGFNERATAVESDDFTAENITFAMERVLKARRPRWTFGETGPISTMSA